MKKTHLLSLTALALAALLQACGSIGEGNRAESIRFATTDDNGQLQTLTEFAVFECFSANTTLVADFTRGNLGDFTSRATYRSSDESRLRVSNGDIPVPGNSALFYSRGTLLPVTPTAPGSPVTVTAEFAGLRADLKVHVATPDSIVTTNEQMVDSDGSTTHDAVQMVPGSIQTPVVTVTFTDPLTAETESFTANSLGTWSTTAPETVAKIGVASGVVTAVAAAPVSYTASVVFAPCSGAANGAPEPPAGPNFDFSFDYQVSNPVRLLIVPEPGYPGEGAAMAEGSQQFLRVLADFDADTGNGEGQDLTFKGVDFVFNPTGVISYSGLTATIFANTVPDGQTSAGPTAITATFDTDGDGSATPLTSGALNLSVRDATLDSIAITPADADVTQLGTLRFSATGTFTPTNGDPDFTQRVDHDVIWRSSDAETVSISNATLFTGLAISLKDEPTTSDITITATSRGLIKPTDTTNGVAPATATLSVVP